MKKLIVLLFISIFTISCSSDSSSDNTVALASTPQAKAEYDSSNFGIYKGVFTGSSGTITINIKNDGNVNARLVIDGVTHNFTCNENVTLNEDTNNLTFTSGNMTFDLFLSFDGGDISVISSSIPNHPDATFNIVKEYSTDLVKCYQGTYTGSDQGVFNLIILDQDIYGLSHSNLENSDAFFLNGTYIENVILGSFENGTFSGSVSGNNISGSWQNTNPQEGSGTWSGKRTL